MTITHTVKLQGAQQYEMEYFTFSVTEDDLPEVFRQSIKPVEIWRVLEYLVQRELLNLQIQSGHMSMETAKMKIEWLRSCLGNTHLSEMLVSYGLS